MIPPPFTVEEFVSLGRYPHTGRLSPLKQQDRRIIAETLELLGLAHIRTRKVNALSGGEMQRAYLAQGLVQTPELLLMDEPTAHLDISHKIRVLDLIDSLSVTAGLSILVILHDLNLASGYCNRVLMLEKGEIRAAGTPEEVLTRRTIEEVYRTPVRVGKDPVTARPHIYFLPRSSAVRRDGPPVRQTEKTNGVLTND
jgi:iron complex transport system ATP-binding protein